ncbi:MAG TPA: hypothetical protein EYQ24_04650 [Bacteroidetes bacterium]|nr:hypothetical protein [Bacteroidota bacterium]HIL57363.1 hypothetical protein [Rhodothermales bacterium]
MDKIGPDYEATLSLGSSLTSVRWRDFLPTDPAIAPRVFDAVEGRFPKRKGLVGTSTLDLYPLMVRVDGLVAEDLPFEETLGREVPTLRRHLGAEVVGWAGRTGYRARVSGAWLDRPSWSALEVPGPNWQEASADLSITRRFRPVQIRTFARVRPMWASGLGLADGSVLWGEVGTERAPGGILFYGARLSAGPSGIGGGVDVRPRTAALGPVSISALARADRQLPEAVPGLPFWVSRGYAGLASEATPLALEGAPRPVESFSLNATAERLWAEPPDLLRWRQQSVWLRAEVDVEARQGETVLLPSFQLVEDAIAVGGPVRAVPAQGAAASAEIAMRFSRHNVVFDAPPRTFTRAEVWTRTRLVLAGDNAFRAARDREPAVRLGALAEHSPDGKLNLRARLEWRSATHWEGWPEPDVPAALLLDLGGEYTFGAFTATLTGRNVLGAPEQTHPLGATLDGRLFVRLAARLGG